MSKTGMPSWPAQQVRLSTDRLLLRSFSLADAAEVQRLAGDQLVADTTYSIPHPYPDGAAEEWISGHPVAFSAAENAVFAITVKPSASPVGTIGLNLAVDKESAELGYWVGVPYWNQGIATEAAVAVIEYGFSQLGLRQIDGWYLVRNPGSGRVMRKAGMTAVADATRILVKNGTEEQLRSCSISFEAWKGQGQEGADQSN